MIVPGSSGFGSRFPMYLAEPKGLKNL